MNTSTNQIAAAGFEDALAKLKEAQKPPRGFLFNFVIFSKKDNFSNYLNPIIQEITTKFPCRLIYIDNLATNNGLNVELVAAGTNKITAYEVHIKTSPDHLKQIPYLIFPLLVPDLPVYLLWESDPTADFQVLTKLLPYASRLIYDADSTVDDLPGFCTRINHLIQSYPKCTFIDINWTLLSGWRQILRQIFDNAVCSELLSNNIGIEIYYNIKNTDWLFHPETQSLYLLEWLASNLNWQIKSAPIEKESEYNFTCTTQEDKFTASFYPQLYPNILPGSVVGINVNAKEENVFSIMPVPNAAKVVAHISSAESCELPFTLALPNLKPGFPYVKELFFNRTGEHYRKMLQTISQSTQSQRA